MSPDDIMASLSHKIEQFESGDTLPITQPEALGELVSLVNSYDVLRDGMSLELLELAGGFHWCRAKARSAGRGDAEFSYALSLMARKADNFASLEFDKHYFSFLANEYLMRVGTGEDELARQAAISFASDVLNLLYDIHPARPALLANLAWTHQSRYEALGHRHDLDQAIDRVRASWESITDGQAQKSVLRDMLVSLLQARLEESGQEKDSEELASIQSSAVNSARSSRNLPDFKYDLRALSVSAASFKALIERTLSFPLAEELASHLGETKAGDLVVESALKRLDIARLVDVLIESGYSNFLAMKLDNEVGKSIVFSFPLIGPPLRTLNIGLGSSAHVRGLWENLAADEAGRSLSTSLLCQQWDWAAQIYVDLVVGESTEQAITTIARNEGGRELARLLGATDAGASFLRKMINDRRFLKLGHELLDSGPGRRSLADLCGSPAMVGFVEDLIARDDAEELLTDILESRYVADVLAPLAGAGELAELHEAIVDSKRRSALADRLAAPIASRGDASAEQIDIATLLLPSLIAPLLKTWLTSIGVAATAEVVYIAAVIAVTHRVDASGGRGDAPQGDDGLWIPLSTHNRPPHDSDLWRRVIGARLRDGVPTVDPADFEDSERLVGAAYRYMTTKDLGHPSPTHQDRILLSLAYTWHRFGDDDEEGTVDYGSKDRLYGSKADELVDLEAIREAVRAAVEGTPRERWVRRLGDILINLAASGIFAAIAFAVSKLMGLAPNADAQVYEIDRMLAQDMDRWRVEANGGGTADSEWTSDDELALIFCIHVLSLTTISGAYERRHARRDDIAEDEMVTPALRLNTEFHVIQAENLGMNVVDASEIGSQDALVIQGRDHQIPHPPGAMVITLDEMLQWQSMIDAVMAAAREDADVTRQFTLALDQVAESQDWRELSSVLRRIVGVDRADSLLQDLGTSALDPATASQIIASAMAKQSSTSPGEDP
jgi:hypothetical protein